MKADGPFPQGDDTVGFHCVFPRSSQPYPSIHFVMLLSENNLILDKQQEKAEYIGNGKDDTAWFPILMEVQDFL